MRSILILALLAVLLLPACAPSVSPAEVEARVRASVAETVAAQAAATAAAAAPQGAAPSPTLVASSTPFPTFTPFATVTPFTPVASGGSSGGSSGGTGGDTGSGGAGAPRYDCALVYQKPADGTLYKPGDTFDVVWTLKNIGTKKILAGYPFQYIGGDDFSATGNLVLWKEVPVGETVTFRLDAFAPQVTGREKVQFTMQWALIVEGDKICKPYVAIFVQKPGGDP